MKLQNLVLQTWENSQNHQKKPSHGSGPPSNGSTPFPHGSGRFLTVPLTVPIPFFWAIVVNLTRKNFESVLRVDLATRVETLEHQMSSGMLRF